jgi:hypothetical protein
VVRETMVTMVVMWMKKNVMITLAAELHLSAGL